MFLKKYKYFIGNLFIVFNLINDIEKIIQGKKYTVFYWKAQKRAQ